MAKQATLPTVHQYGLFEPPLPLEFVGLDDIHSPRERPRAGVTPRERAATARLYGDSAYRFFRRWLEIGSEIGAAVLLVRIGNHLEAWGDDAAIVGRELELPASLRRVDREGHSVTRCDIEHWQLATAKHVLGMAGYVVEVVDLRLNEREG